VISGATRLKEVIRLDSWGRGESIFYLGDHERRRWGFSLVNQARHLFTVLQKKKKKTYRFQTQRRKKNGRLGREEKSLVSVLSKRSLRQPQDSLKRGSWDLSTLIKEDVQHLAPNGCKGNERELIWTVALQTGIRKCISSKNTILR